MRNTKILLIFICFFSLSSLARASILFSDFYAGVATGSLVGEKEYNVSNLEAVRESYFNETFLSFNLGVTPLNLPIFGSLRVQGDYTRISSHVGRESQYGVTLYNDLLRFIPIVNPYIGLGLQNVKYVFSNVKDNKNSSSGEHLYSLHLGVSASLLIIPVDIYLEYKYSGLFNVEKRHFNKYDKNNKDFIIGVRLYLSKK